MSDQEWEKDEGEPTSQDMAAGKRGRRGHSIRLPGCLVGLIRLLALLCLRR